MNNRDVCLADSATTHTILKDKKYFQNLTLNKVYVHIISGSSNLIEGSGRAYIVLPNGTKFYIDDALFFSRFKRNLLSFKNICRNGCHIETTNENNKEHLLITKLILSKKLILEKLSALSSGLCYTEMRTIESHVVMHQKCIDPKVFMTLHDRLGHPESIMMRRIIDNSYRHP
ncbi:hypothetical protein I3760_11G021200 [Carya illinoinensis]|nr:hypothetical protein I3760_11G021200 [Carya illinoinensis]